MQISKRSGVSMAPVCRAQPERGPSAAAVLADPIVAVSAAGTVVVP